MTYLLMEKLTDSDIQNLKKIKNILYACIHFIAAERIS